MGGIPCTIESARMRSCIEIWQLVRRQLRHCKVSAKTILRKKYKANVTEINTNVDYDMVTLQM